MAHFLLLLGRTPDSVRAEGGIARCGRRPARRHVELREIDYAEVLRERSGGKSAAWETIVSHCLSGDDVARRRRRSPNCSASRATPTEVGELMAAVESRTRRQRGHEGRVPDADDARHRRRRSRRRSRTASNRCCATWPRPSASSRPTCWWACSPTTPTAPTRRSVMDAIVSRMTDGTIAHFVSQKRHREQRHADRSPRQAFQTLVHERRRPPPPARPRPRRRRGVAARQTEGFEAVWNHVAEKLLTSYSDEPFVSESTRASCRARAREAIEVEQASDDPPERVERLGGQRRRRARCASLDLHAAARSAAHRAGRRATGAR